MVEFYAANPNDPGDYLIGEEFDLARPRRLPPDGQPVLRRLVAELLELGRRATSTCTTPRASATTSSTCWPRARARRRSAAKPHSSTDLQRLDGHRHRPRRRGEDLVPGADVYMTSSTNYAGARTATLNAARGPLRHRQRAVQRGRRRLERGQRRLIAPLEPGARAGRNRRGPSLRRGRRRSEQPQQRGDEGRRRRRPPGTAPAAAAARRRRRGRRPGRRGPAAGRRRRRPARRSGPRAAPPGSGRRPARPAVARAPAAAPRGRRA